MRFKARSHLHDIRVQGEAASADGEASKNYTDNLAKVLNESKQPISIYSQHLLEEAIEDLHS